MTEPIQYPLELVDIPGEKWHNHPLNVPEALSSLADILKPYIHSAATQGIFGMLPQEWTEDAVNNAVDSIVDHIKPLITGPQRLAKMRWLAVTQGSCDNVETIRIDRTSQTRLGRKSITLDLDIASIGFKVKITLNGKVDPGAYNPVNHCSDSPDQKRWLEETRRIQEMIEKYERQLEEWREAVRLYDKTNGESEFPFAPTDIPYPYPKPPPQPPLGSQRSRIFHIIWTVDLAIEIVAVGSEDTQTLQTGEVTVSTKCCDVPQSA